jgi:hypothetical protein
MGALRDRSVGDLPSAKGARGLSAVIAAIALAACATGGPKHAEMRSTIAPPDADRGRIFFYRDTSPAGFAVQPEIRLNGAPVGRSVPGSFFFVDRAPGHYVVAVATEVENTTTLELRAGESRYVKTSISMGIMVGRVTPTVVDPVQGESDLADLTYIGVPVATQSAGAAQAATAPAASASDGPVKMDDLKDLLPAR